MSDAYERERQNNARLGDLASKVSALRGVTVDIYSNAQDQGVIDSTSETFSSMSTQLKGSAGRLGRMAASGNKVAIFKLSAIVVGVFLVLYYLLKWITKGRRTRAPEDAQYNDPKNIAAGTTHAPSRATNTEPVHS
ncbi:hypothetical protein Micbo1qcDRAFT_229593 [Microdochium bolleyi]|uniref:t-SNARE coiled-coil homology domain-containing protein n=1 Tax=Microdochium bolleyi TaxID=196109 RepID=A0A136JHZ3_9PEZI|nr:hypothetical protein Micbo1qcDRAFT_229593 [Microdochium bolleyi]